MRRAAFATAWVLVTAGASTFLALSMAGSGRGRTFFLPGRTTSGHHQIESKCELCHDANHTGVRQEACLGCHQKELAQAADSHPLTLFLDPRNASFLTAVDGRRCVTCHVEHRPSVTGPMGVSQPDEFCAACHQDIATERPSHRGLPYSGCAAAGCHNYHDNRALGEEFLADHLREPDLRPRARVAALDRDARRAGPGRRPLTSGEQDAPASVLPSETVLAEWASTAHAAAGVNSTACHGGDAGAAEADADAKTGAAARPWTLHPGTDACRTCHPDEATGFLGGKHGMRLAARIGPMRPDLARLPMRQLAHGRELGCTSCHGAHAFDRRRAAVEACLECHDDRHSRAYRDSPHHELWEREQSHAGAAGTGVSCATCHLPRVRRLDTDRPGVAVEHNQNASLRPLETMVRPVCEPCHGVGYSLAALADRGLVERNFRGAPAAPAAAIEMVRARSAASSTSRRPAPAVKEEGR